MTLPCGERVVDEISAFGIHTAGGKGLGLDGILLHKDRAKFIAGCHVPVTVIVG